MSRSPHRLLAPLLALFMALAAPGVAGCGTGGDDDGGGQRPQQTQENGDGDQGGDGGDGGDGDDQGGY